MIILFMWVFMHLNAVMAVLCMAVSGDIEIGMVNMCMAILLSYQLGGHYGEG